MSLKDMTSLQLAEALPRIIRLQAESDSKCVLTAYRIRTATERLAEAKTLAGVT